MDKRIGELTTALRTNDSRRIRLEAELQQLLVGRFAVILVDWRDQPYGSSKKNRKGEIHEISLVYTDEGSTLVVLGDFTCPISLDLITLIDKEITQ